MSEGAELPWSDGLFCWGRLGVAKTGLVEGDVLPTASLSRERTQKAEEVACHQFICHGECSLTIVSVGAVLRTAVQDST